MTFFLSPKNLPSIPNRRRRLIFVSVYAVVLVCGLVRRAAVAKIDVYVSFFNVVSIRSSSA